MKIEGILFAAGSALYALIALAYWVVTHELIGTTALALTACLAFLIGFYVLFTARRIGVRPEDNPLANVDEADPDYGFFSPHSWWPLFLALAAATAAIGAAIGWWLFLIGMLMVLLAAIGFLFEYYRGHYAH